jgi:hypothetical protein
MKKASAMLHSPQRSLRPQRIVFSAIFAGSAVIATSVFWPLQVLSHETLTTTVLFDREIVRILDKHCVMCHVENGPSFPLVTYEQTWVQGRKIRAGVLARHMPPWAAVQGYGQFANDNSLTLRETQFVVSWVEGLGPRNAGTVFTNVVSSSPRPAAVRAHVDFGVWALGEPDLKRPLSAMTIGARQANGVERTVIDLQLKTDRRIRALEYMPGDRRVVRAAFFTVQETGQWLGSWTPWYGWVELPAGSSYRLPAGSHIVAEIHYRGTSEPVVERGTLGVYFADRATPHSVSDLVLEAKGEGALKKLRAETRLAADTYAWALRPEIPVGVKSIEVSARAPNGGTEILLFAKDFPPDWPTPYIFATPVLLRKGTVLSVTAHGDSPLPGKLRLTVSRY